MHSLARKLATAFVMASLLGTGLTFSLFSAEALAGPCYNGRCN
jgi:hypothetical protein